MHKKWIGWGTAVSFFLLLLSACSAAEPSTDAMATDVMVTDVPTEVPATPTTAATEVAMLEIPDLGPAPEIANEIWLNTDEPVTIASQRGKVILLEFWTFG